MSETENSEEKGGGRKPLTLKRKVDAGTVRQNFSHGRSKTVVVEKKRRKMVPKSGAPAEAKTEESKPARTPKTAAPEPKPAETEAQGSVLRTLTDEEKAARSRALENSKAYEAERQKIEAEQAVRIAEEDKQRAAERAERERQKAEEERLAKEAEAREAAEAAAAVALKTDRPAEPKKEKGAKSSPPAKRDDGKDDRNKPIASRKGERRRREGKLTIARALYDDEDRVRSLASVRRAREREKQAQQSRVGANVKVFREVVIPETITLEELSNRMTERVVDVIRKLMENGQILTRTDILDADTAQLIAEEFGHTVRRVSEADVEEGLIDYEDEEGEQKPRAPIVAVMGHVDHGKTSLLDALRETDVASGEAGGITQHIGAYQVQMESGDKITFLDTPGHAAFTAMRARGAKVTDLVILVVAADDGVMPQTIEAISHAKEAEVPIIIAINKMDKEDANPDRVRNELLQYELITEHVGGDVLDVEVSATEKMNLDKLQEAILLQSELLELQANADRPADGVVVEAKLDKGRGPVATVLVRRGTLSVGDIVVAGDKWGKIRALTDYRGRNVETAGPSEPVEVLGLTGAPEPGDDMAVVPTEARAREVAEYRERKLKEKRMAVQSRTSLEDMMTQLKESEVDELAVLIKADVQGSAEALAQALEKMSTEEVAARVIHSGVGGITESDVILAQASRAFIIGFNVRANKQAREHAARDGVELRYYSIIYDAIDDVKAAMSGMLSPDLRETFLGNAEILETFNVSKVGRVAGCRVTEGKVRRGAKVRLIRDNVVIHEGDLSTLKRFKDEVKEVDAGQECGMGFANYQDIQVGDTIECFEVEEVARSL